MSIGTCGRRSSSTCSPTPSSSRFRARSRCGCRDRRRLPSSASRHRDGIPAPELPRIFERFHRIEGAEGPPLRGDRHRAGAGAGAGATARRYDHRRERGRARHRRSRSRLPFGGAHLPAEQVSARAATPQSPATRARAYVEEALRWLPDGERPARRRHHGAPGTRAAAGRRAGRGSCWRTTTPTCGTICARLLATAVGRSRAAVDGEAALAG